MSPECKIKIDLTPEARIVNESADFIVVATTLPKDWVSKNLAFLAALADLCTPSAER